MLLLKSVLTWLIILCLAIANGALREAVLIPFLGKSIGLLLSGVLLSLLIALVAYVFIQLKQDITNKQSVHIGVLWLCFTFIFELSFGRYIQHKSWLELLNAYTFEDGNIWPIVLLTTLLAPYLMVLLHAKLASSQSTS